MRCGVKCRAGFWVSLLSTSRHLTPHHSFTHSFYRQGDFLLALRIMCRCVASKKRESCQCSILQPVCDRRVGPGPLLQLCGQYCPSTSSISNHLPPRRAWTCAPCPGSPRLPSPPPGGGREWLCSTDRWAAIRKANRRCTPRYTVPEGMTRGTRPSTWWRGLAHSPTGSFKVHPIS